MIRIGSAKVYNHSFDLITIKTAMNLKRSNVSSFSQVSTSNDPHMAQIASEMENSVFITDTMMALLMASPTSLASWDLIITKEENGNLFIDSRKLSKIEYLSSHETSSETLPTDPESINSEEKLKDEATLADFSFRQQVLGVEAVKFGENLKFDDHSECAFVYRKFELPNGTKMVVRCQVPALNSEEQRNPVYIRTLCEFDPKFNSGVAWKQKLQSQKGFVLATEFKNNMFKMSRFVAEALLLGTDIMRIGFVSRTKPSDPLHHVILGSMKAKPSQFAMQIGIRENSLWGALNVISDSLSSLKPGTFMLHRVPNEDTLRVYQIPKDHFGLE